MPRQNVFDIKFENIYSLLVQKAERKGRTKDVKEEYNAHMDKNQIQARK